MEKLAREKERLIAKLLREGWSSKDIVARARCSPNTISKVNAKMMQLKVRKLSSIRSEALKMYEKKYTGYQVAVKLDISADEAESYKMEFCKLKYLDRFQEMYIKYNDSLPFIVSKYQEMESQNLSAHQLIVALQLAENLPNLRMENQRLGENINLVRRDYAERQQELWNIQEEISRKKSTKRQLHSVNRNIRKIIRTNYKVLYERVSEIVNKISTNSNWELRLALQAILRAIREMPDSEEVLEYIGSLDSTVTASIFDKGNDLVCPEIIAKAQDIYDLEYQKLVTSAIAKIEPMK